MIEYKIENNDSQQRLDRFLKKIFINSSSSLIYKINRKWKIKVNNKKQDNEYKLQIWDIIKVYLNEEEINKLTKKQESINNKKTYSLSKNIIVYEDSHILILNKPSWINVHPWDHKTKETNIIYMVKDYLWDKLNSLTFSPSLIHRIDRDTSWILLIAKTKNILTKLVSDFKTHTNIKKYYYTLVVWKFKEKKWIIDKKLLRIEDAKNENKVQVSDKWQKAITKFEVLNEYTIKTDKEDIIISELKVEILTWRMHQIRVHLSNEWHPILWDKTYWNKKLNSYLEKNFLLKRQVLHSWEIEFFHYELNTKKKFVANIKEDILSFIDKIKKNLKN